MPYVLPPEELDRLLAVDSAVLGDDYGTPADSPVLRLLASLDREHLAHLVTERRCVPGEVIFQEGDQGDAMYLIWGGRVVVVKGELQSPTILGYRGPGEVIGEMALLEDQPRSATIIALEATRLLRVWRAAFQEWLDNTPALGISIMASLSARLRDADTDRAANGQVGRQLVHRMSQLESERQHLLALQQLRQETSDLVIHDLRNPLGTITGVLSMFEMVLPPDVIDANRDLLDLANSACMKMQRLVDSLLDVSRLETGETALRIAALDLRVLLHEAVNREQLPVKTGRVVLQVAVPDDLPTVVGDEEKLDRVVANLIDNAIKYTPYGG